MVTGNIYVQLLKKTVREIIAIQKTLAILVISSLILHIGIKERLTRTPDPAPANNDMIHSRCAIYYKV